MQTNYQLVVMGIATALAVGGAQFLLLDDLKRLIKTSGLYEQVRTLWRLHVSSPVCEIHGRWDEMGVEWGFCGNGFDDYLEDRPYGENEDRRPECTRSSR